MKEKIPHCPQCRTNSYVVLDKKAVKYGTITGGIAGIGAAITKNVNDAAFKAINASFSHSAISIGNLVLSLFSGFLSGSGTGSAVGEQIDSKLRNRFRCNNCGNKFNG